MTQFGNSRRQVLAGLAAGTAMAAMPRMAFAHAAEPSLKLEVKTREIEVNGKLAKRLAVFGPDGPEGLRVRRGDNFKARVHNRLDTTTLIHWHGLLLPPSQDGVPGISAPAIPAGGYADYDFPLIQGGTYWMHSHVGLQEQLGLAMPLILEDPDDGHAGLQEVVLFLEDFTFKDPDQVLLGLESGVSGHTHAAGTPEHSHGAMPEGMKMADGTKMSGDMKMPAGTKMPEGMKMSGDAKMPEGMKMPADTKMSGDMKMPATGKMADSTKMAGAAMAGMKMGDGAKSGGMAGMAMDLNDVEYDAYLSNSRTLRDPEIVKVERNGKVRVRIINGSASTNFFITAGGQKATLIAVDGEPVHPVDDVIFPICIAQRMDLLVDVAGGAVVPILAQREGSTAQTGLILAAPGANVAKIGDDAEKKSGAMGVELETRLRSAVPLSDRPIDTELLSALTGDMATYVWEMHGGTYPNNKPLVVKTGQRTAVRMRNETGMAHPMHLHGHVFQVIEIGGKKLNGAVRDTVLVPPQSDIVVAFDANNPGIWAYHCHNLYHMAAGMFSYVTYVPSA